MTDLHFTKAMEKFHERYIASIPSNDIIEIYVTFAREDRYSTEEDLMLGFKFICSEEWFDEHCKDIRSIHKSKIYRNSFNCEQEANSHMVKYGWFRTERFERLKALVRESHPKIGDGNLLEFGKKWWILDWKPITKENQDDALEITEERNYYPNGNLRVDLCILDIDLERNTELLLKILYSLMPKQKL